MLITLGAGRIGITDVVAASRAGVQAEIAPEAFRRIEASRAVVLEHAAGHRPVYGLNTGMGGNLGHRIPVDEIRDFQSRIIRGRMIGVGPALPEPLCRAALFCRIVELASGLTGVSASSIRALLALYNAGITPLLPGHASLGASDMGLVAHMAAVVIGLGEAWFRGEHMPGAAALAVAGLAPAVLEPKDGLGLISHGPVTSAAAALTLWRLTALLERHGEIIALSFEGYRANPAILDARLQALHPAAGQEEAAARLRLHLAGSYLHAPDGPAQVQDALCFRDVAPVLGTALAALAHAVVQAEIELNAVTCSPVVLAGSGEMLSAANFHPSSLALALDSLAIALTHLAWAQALRITKLMTASFSGLPKYLSPVGGASAGYVSLQKTAGSLYAEVRRHAAPVMLDSLPVSDAVEDMAPLTFHAVRKLAEQERALGYLAAIEATVAAQAVDLRGVAGRLGQGASRLHAAIRAVVPMLEEDRPPGADVEAVHAVLESLHDGPLPAAFKARSFPE